jgi:DNA replication and repair protein RecF
MTTLDHESVKKHLHDLSISYQLFHVDNGQVSLAAHDFRFTHFG